MKTKTEPSVIHTIPIDMDANTFNSTISEICDLLKEKGLTIKQAQSILFCCKDMLLETVVDV